MKEKGWMKGLVKDTLILFAITLVAGALLGFVNELTKEPIATQERQAKEDACSKVFFEEDANGVLSKTTELSFTALEEAELSGVKEVLNANYGGSVYVTEVYRAYLSDETLYGYVVGITTKEGYGGEISFYMGVTMDGTLKGVSLLSIAETPGLGMNAEAVLIPQFRDVKAEVFTVTKSGAQAAGEIDAITSATITSDAITGGVNAGMEAFRELTKGGEE